MSNREFVYPAKTLSQSRNKFKLPHQHKTSFLHGKCIPLDCVEVLPGDTFKLNLACLIRMSTPIAPIMDNITMHIAAYFVPTRLVYENWEQLMGANKTGAWTQDPNIYKVPMVQYSRVAMDIGDYLGVSQVGNGANPPYISALPGRAYYLIWNEFYRNQNTTAPWTIDHSANQNILLDSGMTGGNGYTAAPQPLGKYSDYFTKCLPQPQKSNDILIPMSDLAVGFYNSNAGTVSTNPVYGGYVSVGTNVPAGFYNLHTFSSNSSNPGAYDPVIANNVSNTINDLRFAFQLQKFYEKDARYGSRYFEMLNGHFGVQNPDLVLQRPEFLGEFNFRINIDQVLSTSGYVASPASTVGAPGANSVTAKKGAIFTKSFTEHGFVIVVGGTRHDHTYAQGLHKMWTREDRLDFYDPCFANIGEQPVLNKEIYCSTSNGNLNDNVFGYQEAWAEYRFIPDRASGLLNPEALGALDYWTLTDKFAALPLLNDSFIYENRDSIARALVTGSAGPDFIGDFYFDLTAVREMPLFSIPGLADHH